MVITRIARSSDCSQLALLRQALWPQASVTEHQSELEAILAGEWSAIYPYVILVAETAAANLVGFAEVTLRSRADSCNPSQPVGYLEGWFVSDGYRRQGIGGELLYAAENWARAQGCAEMASDTWIDNDLSHRAHEAHGFQVVDRCVNYRKKL